MRFVNHQETVITLDFTYFLSVSKITSTLFNFFFLFQLINERKSLSIFNPITTKSHHLLSLFTNGSAENPRDKNSCGDSLVSRWWLRVRSSRSSHWGPCYRRSCAERRRGRMTLRVLSAGKLSSRNANLSTERKIPAFHYVFISQLATTSTILIQEKVLNNSFACLGYLGNIKGQILAEHSRCHQSKSMHSNGGGGGRGGPEP